MSKETEEKENKELSIEECYISLEDEEDNEYEEYKIVSDDELDVEINESKEENIDFKDEYEDETEYSDNKDIENELQNKNTNHRMGKILKIIFFILIVFILLAILDIILVFYYSKGPFFAIPIKTYDDGGTKEYYGIGYKVIKYNQLQGRRDMEIGTYRLKYNATPIEIESLDLSIEFNNNQDKALKLIEDIAYYLFGEPAKNEDPFWLNSAKNYFCGLALYLFEYGKKKTHKRV